VGRSAARSGYTDDFPCGDWDFEEFGVDIRTDVRLYFCV
jgi:hypothetical protein